MRLPVTLRSSLTALTLAALLPVALFAAVVALLLVLEDRETFRRGAEARTLAMITAIDTALAGDIATLEALATLPWLDNDDLVTFRERAERVVATRSEWSTINLALPSGQQVMNLRRAAGSVLPDIAAYDSQWRGAVERKTAFVSDLVSAPVTGEWGYAVRVPVIRDGSVKYLLSAVVKPEAISRLLQRQNLPQQWVGSCSIAATASSRAPSSPARAPDSSPRRACAMRWHARRAAGFAAARSKARRCTRRTGAPRSPAGRSPWVSPRRR